MKKNNLKKVFAALAVSAVAVSATSVAASASEYTDAIRTGQANEEVPYDAASYTTSDQYMSPEGATITPSVKIQKVEVKEAEAPGKTVTVDFTVSGADEKYASIGMHFVYDERLTLKNITQPTAKGQDDEGNPINTGSSGLSFQKNLMNEDGKKGMAFFATAGTANKGKDGVLATVRFTLPENAAAGDLYPIGVEFSSNATSVDGFADVPRTDAGNLMQAYVFTSGIENGYIKVVGEEPESESESESDTQEDTQENTQEDTQADTQEDTQADTQEDTQADTQGETESGTQAGTDASGSTTAPTTDAPPTGVAGVGVAVAGLAVAVGTAFVLRKKED